MSEPGKDQTSRLFKKLFVIIVAGVVSILLLDAAYHHATEKLEKSLHNNNHRIKLGEHIIYGLQSIESDFYKTMTVFNRKGQQHIFLKIQDTVTDLEKVLSVIEEGGVYEHIIPLNIAEQKDLTEKISFKPVQQDEYVVEILRLRVLLADIQNWVVENQILLDKRRVTRAGKSLEDVKQIADIFTVFFHTLQANVKRMEEHANKIYYGSTIHMESIRNEIDNKTKQFFFLATTLLFVFVIILFALSLRIIHHIQSRNKQLLDSEATLRTVADHTHAWEYWIDPQGKFIYCSPSCEQITGFSASRFINDSELLQHIVHPENKPMFCNHAADDRTGDCSFDFRIITQGKQERWLSHTCLAVYDQDGRYNGRRGSNVDITDRKRAETELQNAHSSLEQKIEERTAQLKAANQQLIQSEKLSAIGSLSASIAHEFNNPLCGVQSVIERMNRKNTYNTADQNLITLALTECGRMKRLIQDLQSFNRPTTNICKQIDLHAAIDNILSLIKKELKTRQVHIVKEYDDEISQIYAVEDQLKQVLLNLIKNGGEALEKTGGTITIRTRRQKENIEIAIHDTGNGIKKEIMNNIFDPFFTTKSAVKGTGLGLSVSHGIVKGHGGDIRVESEPGKGTSFTISLPIKEQIS